MISPFMKPVSRDQVVARYGSGNESLALSRLVSKGKIATKPIEHDNGKTKIKMAIRCGQRSLRMLFK